MPDTNDGRDLTNPPPNTDLWLGKVRGQWPVQAFISEDHVATWLHAGEPGTRRAWKVTDIALFEVEMTPPVPPKLRARQG